MNLTPFTSNDWNGWAGAENGPDGESPLLAEFERGDVFRIVIVDGNGLSINEIDAEGSVSFVSIRASYEGARGLAIALTEEAVWAFPVEAA